MDDLISRNTLLKQRPEYLNPDHTDTEKALFAKGWNACNSEYYSIINNIQPSALEPVRHGEWEDIKGAIRCSECQEKPLYDYHGRLVLTRWCHACGVKMWKEIKSENH